MKLNHPVLFLSVVALASQSGIADTGLLNQQLESLLKLNATATPSAKSCGASPDLAGAANTANGVYLKIDLDIKGCIAGGFAPARMSSLKASVGIKGGGTRSTYPSRKVSLYKAFRATPSNVTLEMFGEFISCVYSKYDLYHDNPICSSYDRLLEFKIIDLPAATSDTRPQTVIKNCLTVTLFEATQNQIDQFNFLRLACSGYMDEPLSDFDDAYSNFQKSLTSIKEKLAVIRQNALLVKKYQEQMAGKIQEMVNAKEQIQGNQINLKQLGSKLVSPEFQLMKEARASNYELSTDDKESMENGCPDRLKDLSLVYLEKVIDSEMKIKKAKREVKALLP